MDSVLMFWLLKKHGKDRGYILSEKEWKEFIPYSDKEMELKFEIWAKKRMLNKGCK